MAGMAKKSSSERLELFGMTRVCETELEYSWCVANTAFASRFEFEIVSPTFSSHDGNEWQLMLLGEYVNQHQPYVSVSLVKVSESSQSVKFDFRLGDVFGQIFASKSDEGIFRKISDRKSCHIVHHHYFENFVKGLPRDMLLVQCNMKIMAAENPDEVPKSENVSKIKRFDSRLEEDKDWNDLSTQDCAVAEFKESNTFNISPHNFKNSLDIKCNDALSTSVRDDLVKLSKSFELLYERKFMCDVTLRADDADISAHRLILSARSDYFSSLLESNEECIAIEGFDCKTIDVILFYIYTGKMRLVSSKLALEVLRAAVVFQMTSLTKSCMEIVQSNLCRPDEVLDVLKLTVEVKGLEDLKTSAMKYIGSNPSVVMETDAWNRILQENPRVAGEVLLYVDSISKNKKKLASHNNIDKNVPIKYSKIA